MLLQQFGNDLVLLNELRFNEVSPEDGALLLAGKMDTFPMIRHWRQPFCNRQTPAHSPTRETKISKTNRRQQDAGLAAQMSQNAAIKKQRKTLNFQILWLNLCTPAPTMEISCPGLCVGSSS
ncbi:MAG UNVERIFIED_CONTAM: hypothetical protein LVR18_44730 [Planctomycetaceae bacterium]